MLSYTLIIPAIHIFRVTSLLFRQSAALLQGVCWNISLSDSRPMQVLPSGEDKYVLLDRIGRGGFGYVYRAIDNESGELVAAKLIDLEEAG